MLQNFPVIACISSRRCRGSPTSQRIVFKQLQEGRNLPLDECLRMEYRIVHHLVLNANSDFYSGVDAALISKTGSPVWNPSRLNDVTNEQVNTLFQHLPPHEELQLSLDTQAKGPKL